MTLLEELFHAAMSATSELQESALRILRGELPKSETLLTLRGLSRLTGFGVTSPRRWKVPGHQMGGARRYRLGDVEQYLASEGFRRRQAALRAERKQATNAKSQPGGAL